MATILFVEDSPDNMKLFSALLTLRKHIVVPLASGEGLLGTIEAARPDLILMDIQLPGKDGFALVQEIMVPVERARDAVRMLEAAGVNVDYCESDAGHKVSKDCIRGVEEFFGAV